MVIEKIFLTTKFSNLWYYCTFLYNVGESVEKREHQEFPGPNQLEMMPPGGMTASNGKLNGGIVMRILMYFCTM